MRFFSNEAKENADGQEVADNERDRTESDAAPVPHQRSGSPWSDTPGSASGPTSDTSVAEPDGTADSPSGDDSEVRPESTDSVRAADGTDSHDEVDLPLDDRPAEEGRGEGRADAEEFRAGSHRAEGVEHATAGDSVTDSRLDDETATDSRLDDETASGSRLNDETASDSRVDDETADSRLNDETASDSRVDDETADSRLDDETAAGSRLDGDLGADARADDEAGAGSRVDEALGTDTAVENEPGAEQRGGTTTTYGPDGSITTVDGTAGARSDEDRDLDEAAPVVATSPVGTTTAAGTATDGATATDSTAAGSVTTDSTSGDSATAGDSGTGAAVAAVPVGAAGATTTTTGAAKPDPTAAPVGDRLFTDGDSFNDRLRDIALNFVDNPKEATGQAGALVDEAIEKVTSTLKAQKDALAGEGEDTEKLRVELRGYRDILKRLTAL